MMKQTGAKPDLAWLPVQRCSVDRRYQRQIESRRSQELIQRIAGDFRWAAFQAVLAAPDGKGGFLILDGQHRVEAARRSGIDRVPAVVVATASLADQALAFVRANQDRVVVSQYALFHAQLVAGDEEALAVDRLCSRAAIVIPRYPLQQKHMKPGETLALGTIVKLRRLVGDDVMLHALKAVARGWERHPGYLGAGIIKAAALTIAGQPRPERAAAAVMRHLALTPPKELSRAMRRKREAMQGTEAQAYEAVLRRALELPAVEASGGKRESEATLIATIPKGSRCASDSSGLRPQLATNGSLEPGRSSIEARRADRAERPASKHPKQNIDPRDERAMIDAHLRTKGVTKCPPAYLAPVEGAKPVGPLPHYTPPLSAQQRRAAAMKAAQGKR